MTPEQNTLIKSLTTREEIFDYVEEHLKTQGCRSMIISPPNCAYRGENGMMCAVGCLLADDEYSTYMENHSVTALIKLKNIPKRLLPHYRMLEDLQDLHDLAENWSSATGLSSRGIGELRRLRRRWLKTDVDSN